MVVKREDRKFMKEFIEVYIERIDLERALVEDDKNIGYKKELKVVVGKMNKMLPKYSILFEGDINVLEKIFNQVRRRMKGRVFLGKFKSFLKGVFEELYFKKLIKKKEYLQLKAFLLTFEASRPNVAPCLGMGHV